MGIVLWCRGSVALFRTYYYSTRYSCRYAVYLRAFIVRGRDTLKTWDDTSREDRRKVTQRHVASTTNIKVCIHSRAFDVHTGA